MSKQDKPVAGWKLVPLEPTPQMLSAVLKEFNRANSLHDAMKMERLPLTDREIYCAMIAAAPPPAPAPPVAEPALPEPGVLHEVADFDCPNCHTRIRHIPPIRLGYTVDQLRAAIAADRAARVPVLTDEAMREALAELVALHFRPEPAPTTDEWDAAFDAARAVLAATQGSKP